MSLINVDALYQAFSLVFALETLAWLAIGTVIGVGFGALPGLGAGAGIALVLPLTFHLGMAPSLALIIGIYKGGVYGGSISAISFATPGTPEAAATVYDGYALMQKGKGRKALLMALYASVTADLLSDIITIVVAPLLAIVALKFGPSERFWLMILAITLLGALSGSHLAKGMFAAGLGMFFGTIGPDPMGALTRNTFGLWWLGDGMHLIPVLIGVFAMSRMLEEGLSMLRENERVYRLRQALASAFTLGKEGVSLREYLSCWREMGIGLGIGTFVGMLPGLGSTVGAFLSYGLAKQSFPAKNIGTGRLEGIAAAESGNNATVGPTLIPLLVFGIPGSGAAALIGGALALQGAAPNPRMFELYPVVVYTLFIILLVGNFFNLAIGRMFALIYARLGQMPKQLLVPLVMILAVTGTFASQQNPYDVVIMLMFGFIGLGMRIFGMPEAPMVIAFLIMPMLEESFRRALLISRGDLAYAMFPSPLAITLAVAAVVLGYLAVRLKIMSRIEEITGEPAEQKNLRADLD